MCYKKIAFAILCMLAGTAARPQIVLKQQRELFADNYLVDKMAGVENRLGVPVAAETAIKFDAGWEGVFSGAYVSVTHDGSLYRMYYRGVGETEDIKKQVTCCAESRDGVHWQKPAYRQFKINGSLENNVVLLGDRLQASHNFSVIYDQNPAAAPGERYKAVGGVASSKRRSMRGLYRYVSADGIHWKIKDSIPLFPDGYGMDSQNVLAWLPSEQQYAIYLRVWTGDHPGDSTLLKGVRTIARSVSEDFIHWSEPQRMQFDNGIIEDLYTNATQPYFRAPQLLVSLPFRFSPHAVALTESEMNENGIARSMRKGISDAVLLTSRGGNNYSRPFMESFIRPGLDVHNWAARSNIPALGVVPTGQNEMSVYVTRAYGTKECHIQRMTLRTDGFASLHAGYKEGYVLTRPLQLDGNKFLLNYSTSSVGYVKVVFLDESLREIAGFSERDAKKMTGDRIDQEISWGSASLGELKGKTIRIKFIIRDADIYSFALF
ncbi:hypothetical protein [Niabella aurantiaca]|uniref:hypothetical protein n=1 Tax=Niabella aurantiaca TaxID=379900 RepID=UPI0003798E80|nr:hypothetical protein [Niabella aurantiaca]